jgi:hypothetical protein
MFQKNHPAPKQTLGEVKEQFKKWRRTRKSPRPIPEKLWEAAVGLSAHHSISQISRELILDYCALKKRVLNKKKNTVTKMSRPDFIELDFNGPTTIWECIIEMEDTFGAKMRMHFKNKTDFQIIELVNAFWRKGS